jgi:hypothetical protein
MGDLHALWAADQNPSDDVFSSAQQYQIQNMDNLFTNVGYYPPGIGNLVGDEVAFELDTTATQSQAASVPGQNIELPGRLPADIGNLASDCRIAP